MKRVLPKNFAMMKLLNRNYGIFARAFAAMIGYGAVLLITGRQSLSREIAQRFWTYNDFKVAVRRIAWYCRRGWPQLDVLPDEFFDPTEGMSDSQLMALKKFVVSRRHKLPPIIIAADLAMIAARRLNNNSDPTQRDSNNAAFRAACDQMLTTPVQPGFIVASPDSPRVGDFPIEDAKRTLADFRHLFPSTQLPWFVISGTFLGLIREKGFLAHDYDIDLGVFEEQINIADTIATIRASKTFVLKKYDHHESRLVPPTTQSTNPDIPYILKLVHVSGIHIDLFIHYHDTSTDPEIDWHGSSLHRWENTAFDLIPYKFYDQNVLGPADADRYLTENYGDWRIPVTNFNCTTDTPNLALVPHPIAVALFVKRYTLARGTDPKQAAKLEQELLNNGFLLQNDDGSLRFSDTLFSS